MNYAATSSITSTLTTKKYGNTTTSVPNPTSSNESTSIPITTSSTMKGHADTKTTESILSATAGKYQMQKNLHI